MFQRKRLVRVHYRDSDVTLDGVLVDRNFDHYRIALPKLLEADPTIDGSADVRTTSLDGEVEVPRERVLFLQLLGRSA